MNKKSKCKICRRFGQKLFLKGERCFSSKCAMVRKPYPPGKSGKGRRRISDYGRQLMEKQKLKAWYGLSEKKFYSIIQEILNNRLNYDDVNVALVQRLESRLDNIVFRMGLASSRAEGRQIVTHGHILVDGNKIDRPSYHVKPGMKISVKESSRSKNYFETVKKKYEQKELPQWIDIDKNKLTGEIKRLPNFEEVNPPADIPTIFEFYTR